ncbi:SipW-dependent-type signal peptide-containing protein [Paludicola sp. MB14-C6]|uniref:SipW-dependent-type signal peptide-containing protein n=1 Tax=Paludihabitans sp. MB14-C6 TaxID=3070656 RepID=UPI0027DCE001|nr:SipW-dependent-type signal peptide-containing protein [Paludicola sp. MB14-C6]WMJ21943.1 SipW-dependent-type signal peptide-containing protein [Paludicola sp. MB14-C6]
MNAKIIGLLVAAALVTGMGGFGTHAYFTDTDALTDQVNITMGKLDTAVFWATDAGKDQWVATSKATEVKSKEAKTLSFENVKPGDTFERVATIANYGTLKGDITVAFNRQLAGLDNKAISVELVNVTSQTRKVAVDPNVTDRYYENGVAPNGGWIQVTVKITVNKEVGNDWMSKVINADANEFLLVGTHQTIY